MKKMFTGDELYAYQGRQAFKRGSRVEANPYPHISAAHQAWLRGWQNSSSRGMDQSESLLQSLMDYRRSIEGMFADARLRDSGESYGSMHVDLQSSTTIGNWHRDCPSDMEREIQRLFPNSTELRLVWHIVPELGFAMADWSTDYVTGEKSGRKFGPFKVNASLYMRFSVEPI